MTLVLNEIHLLDGLNRTVLVAAADRLLTTPDGAYFGTHPKLFDIPYLRGAISYFGLSTFTSGGTTFRMWEWLPKFIRSRNACPDLGAFVGDLKATLSATIPKSLLETNDSGFQACAYNADFLPEYWFMSNIREMRGAVVVRRKPSYKAGSVFLLDHARNELGWDGVDPATCQNGVRLYRNGDVRVHGAINDLFDAIHVRLSAIQGFRKPSTPGEYREYVRFKLMFIVGLYRKWAGAPIVGGRIDVRIWAADLERRRVVDHSR